VESFNFASGRIQKLVRFGFNQFSWREDMVKKRFVYIDADKEASEVDDGFNRFLCGDIKDC
jgi:hypothetical protein